MRKERNQFAHLPEQDRAHIFDLCSKNPYDTVVDLLRLSRAEGGLEIVTSPAALCRFYTRSYPNPSHALLAQYANAAHIGHQRSSNAFLGAIRASVEARLLESLKNGKALADLDKEFKFLKTAENLYLEDAKWRAAHPDAARAAYQEHVNRCAKAPDIDFVPVKHLESGSPVEGLDTFLAEPSDFDQDVTSARQKQARAAKEQNQILAILAKAGLQNPPESPQHPSGKSPDLVNLPQTPVIPHIPLNSTKPSSALPKTTATAPALSNPSENNQSPECPPKAAVPAVRALPQVGRNDPCPCASGKKYKKCCLLNGQRVIDSGMTNEKIPR